MPAGEGGNMRTRGQSLIGVLAAALVATSFAAVNATAAGAASSGPKRGGSITYALEAETTGGFCLPSAELAPSGIEVVSAIYDTLVTINSKGQYVPYLAQAVTPNATFDQWTIQLRPNVKFQDGTALDANAVKLNLDTYRGMNPKIGAPLNTYVFQEIKDVNVTGPLTVVVDTKTPWPAFPAYLYGAGRTGMVAPAQLDNMADCQTKMIGTGPFKLVEWRPNQDLIVSRNPNYWRPGLPYLDKITFVPVTESSQQLNGLQAGDYDAIQTSSATNILALRSRKKSGQVDEFDTDNGSDVGYGLLNDAKPPFNDPTARLAVAYAGDPVELNLITNAGSETLATGPFGPGNPAYLTFAQARAAGFPHHDLVKAKALVKQYAAAHGGQALSYNYLTGTDPALVKLAELVKEQDAKAGINVTITLVDQSTQINLALSGDFQLQAFRNQPGGDPDTQYVWWHSGSPVNFSRINDPQIDSDLDQGRVSTNQAQRVALYRDMNKRFASQAYELWTWYTRWAIGTSTSLGGTAGPPLPDGHGQPFALYEGVVPTVGLYKK
jgi:peptide/nickel transport system substrate-binding protein